jgi:hypothetical protein
MNSDPSLRRRQDLEDHIVMTLQLIKQYEDKKRFSSDPKEELKCDKEIDDLNKELRRFEKELSLLNSVDSENIGSPASDEYISNRIGYTTRDTNQVESSIKVFPDVSNQFVDVQYEEDLFNKIGEHLIQELKTPNKEPQKIVYEWLSVNLHDFSDANDYIDYLIQNIVKDIAGDIENSLEAANELEKLLYLSTAMLNIFKSLSNEIMFPEEMLTPDNQLSRVTELASSTVELMYSLSDKNSWGREVNNVATQIEKNLELIKKLNSEILVWINSMIDCAQERYK